MVYISADYVPHHMMSTECDLLASATVSGVSCAALQKAKGAPVIRVATSSGAKIFQLDSLDAREAFLSVANPLWKNAANTTNSSPGLHVPVPDVQKAVFDTNPDVKALYERCDCALLCGMFVFQAGTCAGQAQG